MNAPPDFWAVAGDRALRPPEAVCVLRSLRGLPASRSEAAAAWSYGAVHPAWADWDSALVRRWRAALRSDADLAALVAPLLAAALYALPRDSRSTRLAQAPPLVDGPVREAFARLRDRRPDPSIATASDRAWTGLLAARGTSRTRVAASLVAALAPLYVAELDALSHEVPPSLPVPPDEDAARALLVWLEEYLGEVE